MPIDRKMRLVLYVVIASMPVGLIALFAAAGWAMRSADFRAATNLKSLGIAFAMYAQDDYYPELSPEPGRLMFKDETLFPEHQSDVSILISPADPNHTQADSPRSDAYILGNSSYWYLGYVVWDDETVEAFADAYRQRITEGTGFATDLPVDLPIKRLTRLDGMLRRHGYFTGDEQEKPKWEFLRLRDAEIPVLIERPHPYPGPLGLWLGVPVPLSKPVIGGCVLYKDGHTEFIPYPGKWPMTERTITALSALSTVN
ncbi:MAG: hypothetical protein KJ060_01440 [Candidatus Hydrogenedentes bacterium]|nr:hypothetical protein [Candidatus Hydrogenedentota bacterium]